MHEPLWNADFLLEALFIKCIGLQPDQVRHVVHVASVIKSICEHQSIIQAPALPRISPRLCQWVSPRWRGLTIPEGLVSPSRDEQPREATSIDQRRGKSERHRGQRTKANDATRQNQDASNRRYT